MKLRSYLFYIAAILSLILILIGKIFSNLHQQLFLVGRMCLGAFFIIFGSLHLYQGVVLKKVKLIGGFFASDTYYGKSAIIQGSLVFGLLFIFGLTFLIGIKEVMYLAAPILIAMIVFHFVFPPKHHSPKIKLLPHSKK